MGRKTKLTIQYLLAGFFVMMATVFIMTNNYSFSSGNAEVADLDSVEDGVYSGSAAGFSGPISVEVTFEGGKITDVKVLSHSDSPGISDPAIEEVPAAMVAGNTTEVEVVSGATFTSTGIINAVNIALTGEAGEASEAPVVDEGEEDEEVEVSDNVYVDGTYTETVEGHNGPMTVEVVVEGNVITSVVVLEHEETDGLADPALEDVPAAIIARNGTDVDVVSSATVTSEAVIKAVEKALGLGAKVRAATYNDGTYEATVDAAHGPLSVEVTVADGVISDVVVTEHSETEGLTDPAVTDLPTEIVESNSTDVDVVSGATLTSNAVKSAVDEALFAAATSYQVTVQGHNGPMTVVAAIEDGTITNVEVTEHEETDGLADPALADVPAAIVETNSTEVEVVSGATITSEAIIEAVNLILEAVNN
ncbi:MAG TPA: FMN-binding protein [Atopostipes sp.]|nr:FMN-binding protein [Atopostipes sp.]